MRTSLIALGLLSLGLAHCAGDRGLLVGGERDGDDGEAGEMNETGGTSPGMTGGNGGTANSGGTESSGGQNRGGTQSRGGSGAEGGEDPGTGGTGGTDRGGTDSGGTDAGGSGGDAGSTTRGGTGGSGEAGMGGVAARGGADTGGRAGANDAGAGGKTDADCDALAREYQQLLAAVQQCAPLLTVEQCTRQMPDSVVCGCPTFVNPMREADIRRMSEIIEKTRACGWVCPAIVCPAPTRGVCSTDAIVGTDRGRCVAQL